MLPALQVELEIARTPMWLRLLPQVGATTAVLQASGTSQAATARTQFIHLELAGSRQDDWNAPKSHVYEKRIRVGIDLEIVQLCILF